MSYLSIIEELEESMGRQSERPPQSMAKDGATDSKQWVEAWRVLARLSYGITGDDSRFQPLMEALHTCDAAFASGDWQRFQQTAARVHAIVRREEKEEERKA